MGLGGMVVFLNRYIKNPKIWMCPKGPKRDFEADNYTNPPKWPRTKLWNAVQWVSAPGVEKTYVNYASWQFNRPDPPPGQPHAFDNARGRTPIEWWHSIQPYRKSYPNPRFIGAIIYDIYEHTNPQFWPHKGGMNYLYYDGHVEYFREIRANSNE